MKKLLYILLAGIILFGCSEELTLTPPDKISPENAFRTEANLQLYTNSFYEQLPTATDIVRSDALSDYLVGRTISSYLQNSFNSTQAGGWNWGALRNINYFLEKSDNAEVSNRIKAHYKGIARFFRAYFYFEKVKTFGDVPWYNKTMDVDDPDLYKGRDPRTLVMDSVLADINYACANIITDKDATCSQITKWVAWAMKSRICLFEGTFRKYHTALNLQSTANVWLQQAADAASKVMDSGKYTLNTSGDVNSNYRDLFTAETPNSQEIILAAVCNLSLRVLNDANWYWTSATYGGRYSFTKSFVNSYLNADGSRFTDTPDYNRILFQNEVKNRDLRLKQSIRMAGYKRDGIIAPPDFTYTYTAYQPIKLTLDSKATDGIAENNNSLPIIRFAEVLLNYAEAKAELGSMTPADWDRTIKPLRKRAGILNTSMPLQADSYLKNTFFPEVSDMLILEVRRERSIELALEGFRYDDLKRWKAGSLLVKAYDGMYVAALDTPVDLNEDGQLDVAFVRKIPSSKISGVYYFLIDDSQFKLSNGQNGNLILYENLERNYDEYKYFYPIPFDEIVLNQNLIQNPGWQ